jgi:cyclopropane fatty-acyl-phospholipid synthase-like methyltransferase
MKRAGFAPVGLDLSPQMGRLARKRLRDGSCDVPLVRARAQALPFRSGAFDSVVSTFPTEFIVDPATLEEVARVIGQGGRAVVVPGVVFGASLPARSLELLYVVTGQHKPELPGIASALAHAGLALAQEREPMGLVEVQIVVASKPQGADTASRRLRQG